MFEVICIAEKYYPGCPMIPIPFGKRVEVIATEKAPYPNMPSPEYYRIRGYERCADGKNAWYSCNLFAKVSDIDESADTEAWQSERLTQEDKMLMALAEHMPDEQLDPVAKARIWKNIKATL